VAYDQPSGDSLVINKRLPLLEGDEINLLGPDGPSSSLPWSVDSESGVLTIDISGAQEEIGQVESLWAFRVTYQTSQ
jgi:alpha-L-fucosidase